jgi:hypothetical protein
MQCALTQLSGSPILYIPTFGIQWKRIRYYADMRSFTTLAALAAAGASKITFEHSAAGSKTQAVCNQL